MSDLLQRGTLVLLTSSAVAIASAVVHREFVSRRQEPTPPAAVTPMYVEEWTGLAAAGIRLGSARAPIQIVEFGDLECPFCRKFHESFLNLKREFPDSVALVFMHYPLDAHRFALPASRALECAYEEDRAGAFVDAVFEKQDSLGLKSWLSFARDAGLAHPEEVAACATSARQFDRIVRGKELGDSLLVRGTPTLLINGWMFHGAPPHPALRQMVMDLLERRTPSLVKGGLSTRG